MNRPFGRARKERDLDADLPMAKVRPLGEYVRDAAAPTRFTAILAGIFAAAALLLASIGIYGVLAFAVEQRRHEIGVRLAMGAGSRQILRLVVGRGFRTALAGLGLGLGLGGALLFGRLLAGLLYGVSPADPMTYGGVSLLLLSVAVAASYLPARRAARVDPAHCLRCE